MHRCFLSKRRYLSVGKASTLKALILQSKQLRTTSYLNSRAYAAAGQAGGALHTMSVLPGQTALGNGQGLSPDAVA